MAHYQILYWRHIPLGVKATDITGTVRKNMPPHFQETFQQAAARNNRDNAASPFTTSGFRWEDKQEREGGAAEVAEMVIQELIDSWHPEESLDDFKEKEPELNRQFINLKKL
jgi:hypothetical protein